LEILDNVQQENAYFDELLVTDFDIKEENEWSQENKSSVVFIQELFP
jgi:hypothetical protein